MTKIEKIVAVIILMPLVVYVALSALMSHVRDMESGKWLK